MTVYRIAKEKHIKDLSGEGARLYGGRWNKKGNSLLYTSGNRSLATVEYIVHIPMTVIPKDIFIAEIELPKKISSYTIKEKDLPTNWASYPAPIKLSGIIENLLKDNKFLYIKVPSAIVEGEFNILINPRHRGFAEVRIKDIREYHFDDRLLRN